MYSMQHHSAGKKGQIRKFTGKWTELGNILSGVAQTQKYKYHMFSFISVS